MTRPPRWLIAGYAAIAALWAYKAAFYAVIGHYALAALDAAVAASLAVLIGVFLAKRA